ncbi:MAG TPA: class I SAM-dependent methyltransferase [Vicinamibacteria bacterium]|nr:class I SAM-dependent methyltransferase [Vicinamibacteria bacterium]
MDLLLDAMDKRLQSVRLGISKAQERLAGMSSELALARSEIQAVDRPIGIERERLDEAHYVAFEERYRGSSEELRSRFADYVPFFDQRAPVLDLGCGRGEFLDLLREAGIDARGVDSNVDMVKVCERKGLEATHGHVLSFLADSRPGSAGGIFAAQLIEHLPPKDMKRLLVESHRVLRRGGRIIVETVNPRSLIALLEAYFRDLTHERPLHPETLDFMMRAVGFQEVEIRYSSPVTERAKLLPVLEGERALKQNFEKLNALLFGDQDYAAIATKG